MSATIELREIFKLAHHDIANKIFDQFAEEVKDVDLENVQLEEAINLLTERVTQIYQEELKKELINNANKVIERSTNT
jgi:serine/threonine protein kinase HipA of HipAB toxin-antitoxin module